MAWMICHETPICDMKTFLVSRKGGFDANRWLFIECASPSPRHHPRMRKEPRPQALPAPLHPVVHIQRRIAIGRIGHLHQAFFGAGLHRVQGGVSGRVGADAVDVGGVFAAQGRTNLTCDLYLIYRLRYNYD